MSGFSSVTIPHKKKNHSEEKKGSRNNGPSHHERAFGAISSLLSGFF